jgi:hypothetical protein
MTQYIVRVNGDLTDYVRSTKATAVTEADRVYADLNRRANVDVVTGTGHVAYALNLVKARIITKFTRPFTKVITLPAEIAALVPEGYVTAYARLTHDATVLRRTSDIPEDDSRWAVMNTSTGEIVAYVPSTRDAGQVMKGMKRAPAAA